MKKTILLSILFALFCSATLLAQQTLNFTILQINDEYEIAPLENGTKGGMARVATVRKQLLLQDPNTITMMAGDFVSPSLIGTLSYFDSSEKKMMKVAGRQMVEVMNETGVDYVTFGNHEFDISLDLLAKRINESNFKWVNSNVWMAGKTPFTKTKNGVTETIPPFAIHTVPFPSGQSVRVGIIGVTIPFNFTQPGLSYTDVDSSVNAAYQQIKDQCDVIIALTHLSIDEDKQLAKSVPGLHLIIGGHEHVASQNKVGNVLIYKADANVKSAYVHRISFNPATKQVNIQSDLKMIDETVPLDPTVNATVKKWVTFTDSTLRAMGYDPTDSLMFAKVPLDGREEEIRNRPTNYTKLIGDAIYSCDSTVDLALYNSGSLRIDDQLQGIVTQYDILRSLPFGGGMVIMQLPGDIVQKILTTGTTTNKNSGGYLQLSQAQLRTVPKSKKSQWTIKGIPLSPKKVYKLLVPEFVAKGNESNLGFLRNYGYCTPNAFKSNALRNDIRDIVIWYMKHKKK